jgi:hypothetical protein
VSGIRLAAAALQPHFDIVAPVANHAVVQSVGGRSVIYVSVVPVKLAYARPSQSSIALTDTAQASIFSSSYRIIIFLSVK